MGAGNSAVLCGFKHLCDVHPDAVAGQWHVGFRSPVFYYFECGGRRKLAGRSRCHQRVSATDAGGLRPGVHEKLGFPYKWISSEGRVSAGAKALWILDLVVGAKAPTPWSTISVIASRIIAAHRGEIMNPSNEADRLLLRHTLATVAYRTGKALRGAPESFANFQTGQPPKTPASILAHMGDLYDWAL